MDDPQHRRWHKASWILVAATYLLVAGFHLWAIKEKSDYGYGMGEARGIPAVYWHRTWAVNNVYVSEFSLSALLIDLAVAAGPAWLVGMLAESAIRRRFSLTRLLVFTLLAAVVLGAYEWAPRFGVYDPNYLQYTSGWTSE